jgi:predicted dehydrogenase
VDRGRSLVGDRRAGVSLRARAVRRGEGTAGQVAALTQRPGDPLRIGMVGSGFMAQLHSAAYLHLPVVFRDAVPRLELKRIAGGSRVHEAARDVGWAEVGDDWQAVTEAEDIDLVDIVTPNDTHADLVASAAAHGKTIVCEKPLARDGAEARRMGDAVARAGVSATVWFMYRMWPATQVAKTMIDRGDLGRIHGFRGRFLHDHVTGGRDPAAWRLDPAWAGSGVVGDIGSHALDLARHLVGDVAQVFATTRSVLPAAGPVDDDADILLRFENGAQGHVWLGWLATGTTMDRDSRSSATTARCALRGSAPPSTPSTT